MMYQVTAYSFHNYREASITRALSIRPGCGYGERRPAVSTILTCPICDEPLAREGASLRCPRGHSFDVAREGYVNLLTGKPRGDTREMALARRTFLEQGWYRSLADQLAVLSARCLADAAGRAAGSEAALAVVDAGCGEGYYLGHLLHALSPAAQAHETASGGADTLAHAAVGWLAHDTVPGERVYVGVDISKDVVRLAARRYPQARFVVADLTRRLPIATGAVSLLLNVFAPRHAAEFARVVAPGGSLLVVIPEPAHLAELRDALSLLGVEPEKERHVITQLATGFALAERESIEYTMRLDRAAVAALVTMTPNAWHRGADTAAAIASLGGETAVTASFRLLRFQRR